MFFFIYDSLQVFIKRDFNANKDYYLYKEGITKKIIPTIRLNYKSP